VTSFATELATRTVTDVRRYVRTYGHLSAFSKKGKGFPYSIPSVGPGADPAVSPQVTVSHPPGVRLPLLSDRSAVTSPAAEQRRPLAGTK